MRILMLGPSPEVRGPIPKHTPLLIEGLRSQGCSVTYFRWGRHSDNESPIQKTVGRIRDIRGVRRELAQGDYDLLVVKTAHDWATLARDLALMIGVGRLAPLRVLQFHGSDPSKLSLGTFRRVTGHLLRRVHGSLVLSTEEQREWRRHFPQHFFSVVKNPYVVMEELRGEHPDRPLHSPPRLLFTGRIIPEKGVFDLLQALAALRTRCKVHLTIAGDGPDLERLRARVRDLHLEDAVRLTGYLGRAELARAYAEADVFVLPTYWLEGFPTSITEALQAGLPVVTTPIRGTADYLEEGVHALFVPPRNPEALAGALERLLADDALRLRMGRNCRGKLEEFSPDVVAREYLAELNRIRDAAGSRGEGAP